MTESGEREDNVHRLVRAGTGDPAAVRAELESLRQEITRRDEILKLVLERLPRAGDTPRGDEAEATRTLERRTAAAEAERDAARARFRELRKLATALMTRVGERLRPIEDEPAVRRIDSDLRSLRADSQEGRAGLAALGARVDALAGELERVLAGAPAAPGTEALHALRDEVRGEIAAGREEALALARDVAALRDRAARDRAVMAEMRLDLDSLAARRVERPTPAAPDPAPLDALRADVDAVRGEVAGIKAKIVRFLLDQMRQGRT